MLSRICFAIGAFWSNRVQLKRFMTDPNLQLPCVLDLTLHDLKIRAVQVLVLDYDGVLASHAEPKPRAEVIQWLIGMQQKFAPHKIFILSNKPTLQVQAYFKQNFPEIAYIVAKCKKPYPNGLQEIARLSGVLPAQVLIVDDRLGTGVLASIIAGAQSYWITKPYISLSDRPFKEAFFIFMRWLERICAKNLS